MDLNSSYDLSDLLAPETAAPSTLPREIKEPELAALLGITRQRISELVRSGILTRSGRARFNLAETVRAYCGHLREHAGRTGRPSQGGDALKAERLRLVKAQAEAQEHKNRQLANELVDAAAVQRTWESILRDVRAAMLAVPSRFGATQPHLTQTDVAALDREIRAALEGLSDGND